MLVHRILLIVLILGGPLAAQDDLRIDADTGRSTAHYPPARHFDHVHMRLELDIADMGDRRLTARQTLTLAPIGRARSDVHLDAVELEIAGVWFEGRSQPFTYDGADLVVHLDRSMPAGETFDLVIEYAKRFAHATGAGLTWTLGEPEGPSLTDRSPQIHTQGQPESNSSWFPCHDSPNERLTTELIVRVDSDYQVCSNGRLVSREDGTDGRATWHWRQDAPHSSYLVVLVIGRFAVVGLGDADWNRPDLPLTVYAPVGSAADMAEAFARTPAMIEYFEERFDEPFPWAKYAQLLVRNFAAGAMENTSATTFHQRMALRGGIDGIIAHELVHQWMGDLVAYKAWEDLWLGEGWATYGEALWAEHAAGPEGSQDAYYELVYRWLGSSRMNTTYAPRHPGLASKYYASPDHNFFKANNPYSKGALVLHMLRMRLGDETFFDAVALYIDRYRFKAAETDDFRRVLEEVSGQNLERFFRQWVTQPGMPRLEIDFDWHPDGSQLFVGIKQTQRIDADNPAYAFTLPIYVSFENGEGRYVYVPMETRKVVMSFEMEDRPSDIEVDPNIRVAAHVTVTQPLNEAVGIKPDRPGPGASQPSTSIALEAARGS